MTLHVPSGNKRDATLADDLFTFVHDGIGSAPAGFCLSADQKQARFTLRLEDDYLRLLKTVHVTRFKSLTLFVDRDPPARCQPSHPRVELEPWPLLLGHAELFNTIKSLHIGAYCPSIEPASALPSPNMAGQISTTSACKKHGKASFRVPSVAAAELAVRELANARIDQVGAITATWSLVSDNKRSIPRFAFNLGASSNKAPAALPPGTSEQS